MSLQTLACRRGDDTVNIRELVEGDFVAHGSRLVAGGGSLARCAFAVVDPVDTDRLRFTAELNAAGALAVIAAATLETLTISNNLSPLVLLLSADAYADQDAVASTLSAARGRFAPQRIVLMGHVPAIVAFAAARAGADALMLKPANLCDLMSLLGVVGTARKGTAVALPSLARVEWEYLHYVLECCAGNRSQAARRLGIHRSVLQRKLSRLPPAR